MDYAEALSAKERPGTKRQKPVLRRLEMEQAENGGHTVTHRFNSGDGPYVEPKPYVFGEDEGKKLVAHLVEHMGIKIGKGGVKGAKAEGGESEKEKEAGEEETEE